jgi:predicted acetyltransferase
MPGLSAPTTDVHASFLTAMAEFRAEGRGRPADDSMLGSDLRRCGAVWSDPGRFATYVAGLRAQGLEETPRPAGLVPCTTLWWLDGEQFLGRLAIRHRLTERLRRRGGHIGYDVRPSARRRGHATAMLRAALPVARGLGIRRVLVTCDEDNVASRAVIEANGGVRDQPCAGTLRYWMAV